MQEQITILQSYPDLGDCSTHLYEIRKVCTEPKCIKSKYLCEQCSVGHKDHKMQSSQEYVDQLAAKLISNQPNTKTNRTELQKSFVRLGNIVSQFQEQMMQTAQILKNINLRQYILYEFAVSRSPETLREEMNQWNIRENGGAIQKIIEKLAKMNMDDAAAPAAYKKWVDNIEKMINKFMGSVERLREEVFTIQELFDIEPVLKQIRKSKISTSQISSPPKVVKPDPSPTEAVTKIDLGGKQLISQQIIEEVVKYDTNTLTTLNLQANKLDTEGLHQLLNIDKKFNKLEQLILNDNCLENNCLDVLLKANLPNLKVLNIQNNFCFDDESSSKRHNLIAAKWPGIDFKK